MPCEHHRALRLSLQGLSLLQPQQDACSGQHHADVPKPTLHATSTKPCQLGTIRATTPHPQQELLFSAFFRMTANRVGRPNPMTRDDPSNSPLQLLLAFIQTRSGRGLNLLGGREGRKAFHFPFFLGGFLHEPGRFINI